jgi:DNA-directed RNA polymerase specialized sigma24 family protein
VLEVPLGTVKSRIARGLAQLRILVREKGKAQTISMKGES